MTKFRSRKLAASWLATSVSSVLILAASAYAQVSTASPAPATKADDQPIALQKFVVTGSNIPTTLASADAGAFPLVSIGRAEIDITGFTNTAQLLQTLTVSNYGGIPISNNNTGFTPAASAVSIHGLGPEATLVLLNGHRLANFPVGQSGSTAFVDLNTIPLAAIERVDVLKDGASAEYGADAVAGVVNVILRKNFEGSQVYLAYQNTTNKDSSQFTANVLTGVSSEKGSLLVSFNYQSRASIAARDRAYSAVPAFLSTNSSPINLQISAAAYDEALGLPAGTLPTGVTKSAFYATPGPVTADGLPTASGNKGLTPPSQYTYSAGRSALYNYNQDQLSFPAWDRYGVILNGERRLFENNDNVHVYFDGGYQKNMTENQLAPTATGSFTVPGQIELVIPARTTTPLPMADGRARAAAPGAYNPFNPFNQDIAGGTRFRLKEFGNRIQHETTDSFLATAGLRIDNIADKFTLDAGYRFNEVTFHSDNRMASASRFNQILNAADPIFNPSSSSYVGTTTPYNPFGYYVNTIANNAKLVEYATVHIHNNDTSRTGNAFVTLTTTDLFSLPAGEVGAAAGFDYRAETLSQSPDSVSHAGDVIGESPAAITDHHRFVYGVYAELQAPIVAPQQHVPGVYDLSVNLAARHENFMTNHQTTTVPKIGILYHPFDTSLSIRASASKGFLEPSLYELYAGPVAALTTVQDVSETPVTTAGNPRLTPEKTKSYNLGFVWAPKYWHLNGLTTNVDFWRVDRRGTVSYDYDNLVERFRGTAPGGLQPGESVVLDPSGEIAQVNAVYINAGDTIAYGVDLGINYTFKAGNLGRFTAGAAATNLISYKHADTPGAALEQQIDQSVDGEGEDAYLRWKGTAQLEWSRDNYQAAIVGYYINGFHDFDLNGDDRRVGSSITWDIQFSYNIGDRFGAYLKNTKVTVGAFNIFDRNPPLSQYGGANPWNYPGFIYTSEGRRWYVSLDKKF